VGGFLVALENESGGNQGLAGSGGGIAILVGGVVFSTSRETSASFPQQLERMRL